jgi:preprotein translocase subunit SecE
MKLFLFIEQVKQEMLKVMWPTRKEVLSSAFMVLVAVFMSACFFFLIDSISHNIVQFLLRIGGE